MNTAGTPKTPFLLPPGTTVRLRRSGASEVTPCQVDGPLERGTFSQTYLASTEDGAWVVLKTSRWIDADRIDSDLLIEEKILAQVDHPNLVRFLGSARDPAHDKLILGHERGFPHPQLVLSQPAVRQHFPDDAGGRHCPLPPRVALGLGVDLLRGIEHLHKQGFVHHDIKLANLLVRVPGAGKELSDHDLLQHALAGRAQAFLIDIGGSRAKAYLHELNRGRTDFDVSVVPPQLTPKYAPPEAVLPLETPWGKRPQLLPSMDLYAAACLIYATVTGLDPYDHMKTETDTFAQLQALKEAERTGDLHPLAYDAIAGRAGYQLVAGDLYSFLSGCMHRNPDERPNAPQAREFLEEVRTSLLGKATQVDAAAISLPATQPFFGRPARTQADD